MVVPNLCIVPGKIRSSKRCLASLDHHTDNALVGLTRLCKFSEASPTIVFTFPIS